MCLLPTGSGDSSHTIDPGSGALCPAPLPSGGLSAFEVGGFGLAEPDQPRRHLVFAAAPCEPPERPLGRVEDELAGAVDGGDAYGAVFERPCPRPIRPSRPGPPRIPGRQRRSGARRRRRGRTPLCRRLPGMRPPTEAASGAVGGSGSAGWGSVSPCGPPRGVGAPLRACRCQGGGHEGAVRIRLAPIITV